MQAKISSSHHRHHNSTKPQEPPVIAPTLIAGLDQTLAHRRIDLLAEQSPSLNEASSGYVEMGFVAKHQLHRQAHL